MRELLTTLLLSGALIGSSVAGTAMALSPLPASATDTASAETTAIPEDAADYIIDKAADAYSEDLWEKALTFDMSVLQDNGTIPAEQASTGTVQFLIAGPQFYFRMSVKDPTRNPNDSPPRSRSSTTVNISTIRRPMKPLRLTGIAKRRWISGKRCSRA